MADPLRKIERARRDALRFASNARRLAARNKKVLPKGAPKEIEAACDLVEKAVGKGDPGPLSAALHALDALWIEHLDPLSRPAWQGYALSAVLAVALALSVRAFVAEGMRVPSGSMAPTLIAGDRVLVSKLAYGPRIPFTSLRPWGEAPRRGDVVVFEDPRAPGHDLVKRVAGVPGDVVELRGELLFVNGVPQPRSVAGDLAYQDRGEGGEGITETCRRYREALARGPLAPAPASDPGALEASWQAAAAAGVATHEILQCRRTRPLSREGPFAEVAPDHVFVLGDNRDRSADSRSAGGYQVPLGAVKGRASLVLFSVESGGGKGGVGRPRLGRLFKPIE